MGRDERKFRTGQVIPFLKRLKNTFYEPIQQMAICGSPDYLLCVNGKFVALELKDIGGVTTQLQKYKLSEIARCRGISLIADPNNWDDVKRLLLKLDQGEK
jgi:hypothetical protein